MFELIEAHHQGSPVSRGSIDSRSGLAPTALSYVFSRTAVSGRRRHERFVRVITERLFDLLEKNTKKNPRRSQINTPYPEDNERYSKPFLKSLRKISVLTARYSRMVYGTALEGYPKVDIVKVSRVREVGRFSLKLPMRNTSTVARRSRDVRVFRD